MTAEGWDATSTSAFQLAMAATVDALRIVTTAVAGASGRNGNLPSVDSVAMADQFAQEHQLRKVADWDVPMSDAQTIGAMTLLAAADYVRCYGELFSGQRSPVFGHLVQARAGLEACVVSRWLNDPQISAEERQRRTLCELIYSAKEVKRLGIEEAGKADERIAMWDRVAAELEWPVTWPQGKGNGKPNVGGAQRPSVPAGIDALITESPGSIGRVQWSYLSAVGHVTFYGLRQSFLEDPKPSGLAPSLAPIGTESKAVNAQTLCLLRALRTAAEARMTYMGWADDEWVEARTVAMTHEAELYRRIMAAQAEAAAAENP
jgi:hypothetical protein